MATNKPILESAVLFVYGSQANYDKIQTKDANTLYFCYDTARIFVGDVEYTRPVQHGTAVPEGFNPPNSFFLVDGATNKELHYSQDGASWVKIAVLPKSVTSGVFGQAATATLAWGGKFIVPKITIDENGYAVAGQNIELTLPEETALSTEVTGDGNAITTIEVNGHKMTIKKEITFASDADLKEVKKTADGAVQATGGAFTGPITVQTPSADMNPATKAYVDSAIASVTQFDYQIVTELPETGVKGTIYLKSNSGKNNNVYDEYIWVVSGDAGSFEKIGTTEIDLTGYAKLTDLPEAATADPAAPAAAASVGTSEKYAREDHVHAEQESVAKLKTARKIEISGAATAEVTFDGSADVNLEVESVDGSKVSGKVSEADKASKDGDGKDIKETYATKEEAKAAKLVWGTFDAT